MLTFFFLSSNFEYLCSIDVPCQCKQSVLSGSGEEVDYDPQMVSVRAYSRHFVCLSVCPFVDHTVFME